MASKSPLYVCARTCSSCIPRDVESTEAQQYTDRCYRCGVELSELTGEYIVYAPLVPND